MVILISVLLSSCSGGYLMFFTYEGTIADKWMKKVVKAIEKQDKDAFRQLFFERALDEANDFEENMDYLFELFQGEVKSWKRTATSSFDDYNNGHVRKEINSSYDIESSDQKYHMSLKICSSDNKISKNVGIKAFCIINENDWREAYVYWGDWDMFGIIIDH